VGRVRYLGARRVSHPPRTPRRILRHHQLQGQEAWQADERCARVEQIGGDLTWGVVYLVRSSTKSGWVVLGTAAGYVCYSDSDLNTERHCPSPGAHIDACTHVPFPTFATATRKVHCCCLTTTTHIYDFCPKHLALLSEKLRKLSHKLLIRSLTQRGSSSLPYFRVLTKQICCHPRYLNNACTSTNEYSKPRPYCTD
jgi:hypothetical protein